MLETLLSSDGEQSPVTSTGNEFSRKWESPTGGLREALKPTRPLKTQILNVVRRLEKQIQSIDICIENYSQRDKQLFQKLVEAYRSQSESNRRILANELAEIRKHQNLLMNSRLSLNSAKLRLRTTTEIGNFASLMGSALSSIEGVRKSISGLMPEISCEIQEIEKDLFEISDLKTPAFNSLSNNIESVNTEKILKEAALVAQTRLGKRLPESPTHMPRPPETRPPGTELDGETTTLKENEKGALLFLHLAKKIGRQGASHHDCLNYKDSVRKLISSNLVLESGTGMNTFYSITEIGEEKAKSILDERMNNLSTLSELLSLAPRKLLHFLISEFFTKKPVEGDVAILELDQKDGTCLAHGGEHRCLLMEPIVNEWKDKILRELERASLCFAMRDSFGQNLGPQRTCLLPNDVIRYLKEFDINHGLEHSQVFTSDLEDMHRLYHTLDFLKNQRKFEEVELHNLLSSYQSNRERCKEIVEDLISEGVLHKDGFIYEILNQHGYSNLVRERLLTPLVDELLEIRRIEPTKDERVSRDQTIIEEEPFPFSQKRFEDISILLGENAISGLDLEWKPSDEKNPHMLVVGTTGSGKTETLRALVYELKKNGIPCLILDYHNEYSEVTDLQINVREGVTINPLELFERSPLDTVYETSSILREIYGLGDQQEAILRQALRKSYEEQGIIEKDEATWGREPPTFLNVKRNLELLMEDSSSSVRSIVMTLLNRLEPTFDVEIFSGNTTIPFKEIVKRTTSLQLKDLPTEQVKIAASDFFLRRLWYFMYKLGQSSYLRLYCAIDEGHRLAYDKSPLDQFLREARKYGVGVILSSQRPSDFSETIIANIGSIVCLQCPLESDARFMSKQINCSERSIQFLGKVGRAIVKFSSNESPFDVQISPISERE